MKLYSSMVVPARVVEVVFVNQVDGERGVVGVRGLILSLSKRLKCVSQCLESTD